MNRPESEAQPAVFVIDDDKPLREALERLFRLVGLHAESFATAAHFLNSKLPDVPTCLVLDVRLPGISGLDFQAELAKANIKIPIIFMTGHGDIPMAVEAMKAGAVEFLPKPFRDQDMLDAVHLALERDRTRREAERANAELRTNFDNLSARERGRGVAEQPQEMLRRFAHGLVVFDDDNIDPRQIELLSGCRRTMR